MRSLDAGSRQPFDTAVLQADGEPLGKAAPIQYATHFDRHFLSRGLALLHSLHHHSPHAVVWVLCLDQDTHRVLSSLQLYNVRLLTLAALEGADPDLARTRGTRSLLEYYFTLTAPLLLHVLRLDPSIETLVYVDADLFFFDDPAPVFDEYRRATILLIDHDYPAVWSEEYKYGRFNVGLIVFWRSEVRLPCLQSWRAQCLQWCFDVVDGDRYADQKYLDAWPDRFAGIAVAHHRGLSAAPWNIANHRIRIRGKWVLVDDEPLVSYHFHGLRIISDHLYDTGLHRHHVRLTEGVARGIYRPYLLVLSDAERRVRSAIGRSPLQDSIRKRRRYGPLHHFPHVMKLVLLLATIRRGNLFVLGTPRATTVDSKERTGTA